MVWTVTQLEPVREFTWAARQPGLSLKAVHRLDDTDGHVATTLEFNVTGPLAWLAAPMAGRRIRSYLAMESRGLKRAAERG
jgi:hypothetical protein